MTEEKKPTEEKEEEKSLSVVEEAAKVRDEIKAENDRRESLLKEEQKLKAENMLAGTTGGHVEPKVEEMTEEEKKNKGAEEYFKGTQLEKDIQEANKRDG